MPTIYSIGHSNLKIGDFIALLKENDIELVVDIRRYPSSFVYSTFEEENIKEELDKEGIDYIWKGEIFGGFRDETLGDESPNKGWDATGFRTYADHALSDEFQEELDELIDMSESKNIAIMCAESIYWKCYRRILCDWLVAKGKTVIHLRKGEIKKHEISSRAVVEDGKVTYPENKD
ncbi:MAG: DUF488 family protein [Candidatus Natronoplasma sp.]